MKDENVVSVVYEPPLARKPGSLPSTPEQRKRIKSKTSRSELKNKLRVAEDFVRQGKDVPIWLQEEILEMGSED